jgi:hypothetical protein
MIDPIITNVLLWKTMIHPLNIGDNSIVVKLTFAPIDTHWCSLEPIGLIIDNGAVNYYGMLEWMEDFDL